MNKLRLAIVSFGFLGCSPFAPGTVGTLGGVAIAYALMGTGTWFPVWVLVIAAALYALGRPLGAWAEQYAGKKDPGIYVIDEVIGYLITVLWIDAPSLMALVVAFFVFRFFDVLKPPLARRAESLPGGDGILLDDVVAGLHGLVLMVAARFVLPGL
ncbi:MAG: phosphatidylglycerophosphatase A [Planctomycetes bacterium]|nr:phosphatidylglycerophosphatase A [Planctomycetota bacterium]